MGLGARVGFRVQGLRFLRIELLNKARGDVGTLPMQSPPLNIPHSPGFGV